jgi:hypothetical protein
MTTITLAKLVTTLMILKTKGVTRNEAHDLLDYDGSDKDFKLALDMVWPMTGIRLVEREGASINELKGSLNNDIALVNSNSDSMGNG